MHHRWQALSRTFVAKRWLNPSFQSHQARVLSQTGLLYGKRQHMGSAVQVLEEAKAASHCLFLLQVQPREREHAR